MGMIKGSTAVVDVLLVLRADGNDATGLTPTARLKGDGGAWANATNAMVEGENGSYSLALTGTETNVDHLAIKVTANGAITQLINIYTVDVEQYKADVSGLSTFDHTSDEVTTDAASRAASQADVSGLATATELAKVPKKDVSHRYTNTGSGAGYDDVTIADAP